MTRRKIIIIALVLVLFGFFGLFLGAGNYGYAQRYDYSTNKDELIQAIKDFKYQNPQYRVPSNLGLIDTWDRTNGYYHAYIYYAFDNKTIHFVTFSNPDNWNKSSIYLDAVNEGRYLGNWKVINKDYDRKENLLVKKLFAEGFLNKLKIPYKDSGNGMFIFWK